MKKKLSFDNMISKFGTNIALRCSCCSVPQVESMQHVFVESEDAMHIWKNIASPLGITHPNAPIAAVFKNWWEAKPKNKIHGLVLQATPTLICWKIWKQRSSCRYGTQIKFQLNIMKRQGFMEHNLNSNQAYAKWRHSTPLAFSLQQN